MFSSVRIASFRGLRDLELQGLGRINLLVGGTNSGKTSALEALSILSAPLDALTWLRIAQRREPSPFTAGTSSKVERIKYLFPLVEQDSFGAIRLDVQGRGEVASVEARAREIRGVRSVREAPEGDEDEPVLNAAAEVERTGLEIEVKVTQKGERSEQEGSTNTFQVWDQERLTRSEPQKALRLPFQVITPYDHWLRLPVIHRVSEATLGGNLGETIELLKGIDPHVVDLRIVATQRDPVIYLRDERAGFLPLSAFGDGMRRALILASALPRARGGVLLVDEIETGLHPSLLSKLYGWLVKACVQLDTQVFATTHSLEAIDALLGADDSDKDETVGFRLSNLGIQRYGETQLRRLREERGLDVR